MFGWFSFASARASRENRSEKAGSLLTPGGQDLQGDDSIEFLLANLIDRTHAAAAEEFKDLELGKSVFEFPRRGRSVARGTTGRVSGAEFGFGR